MNHDDPELDETESAGATMIRLDFKEWEYAPPFDHLKDAPIGESETCDTIWPVGMDIVQPSPIKKSQTWTLGEITTLLEKYRQRATYSAVAGVIGGTARNVMSSLPKIPRNSWVVSQKNGLPTGYGAAQLHCDLEKRANVMSKADELLNWLENPM